jgi:hypothetical protein
MTLAADESEPRASLAHAPKHARTRGRPPSITPAIDRLRLRGNTWAWASPVRLLLMQNDIDSNRRLPGHLKYPDAGQHATVVGQC